MSVGILARHGYPCCFLQFLQQPYKVLYPFLKWSSWNGEKFSNLPKSGLADMKSKTLQFQISDLHQNICGCAVSMGLCCFHSVLTWIVICLVHTLRNQYDTPIVLLRKLRLEHHARQSTCDTNWVVNRSRVPSTLPSAIYHGSKWISK